jgi:tetratricopeptide (TPR) repeat protein
MRAIYICTFFFLGLLKCFSQDIDSLKQQVNKAADSDRFDMILGYMRSNLNSNPQASLIASNYALEFAQEKKDSLLLTKALYAKGFIHRRLNNLNESVSILTQAHLIAKRNSYNDEVVRISNSLAIAYTFIGSYDKALKYHFESLTIN